MTEQEIKNVAEEKYTQHYNGGHDNGGTTRIDSISINAFIEGAKWTVESSEYKQLEIDAKRWKEYSKRTEPPTARMIEELVQQEEDAGKWRAIQMFIQGPMISGRIIDA